MTSIRTAFLITDAATSPAAKATYKQATKRREVNSWLARIAAAQNLLIDITNYSSELESAVLLSLAGGESIEEVLRSRHSHVMEQIKNATGIRRTYIEECKAIKSKIAPLVTKLSRELMDLTEQEKVLSANVASFEQNRESSLKKLQDAGLSIEEIAAVSLKPTADDLEAWKQDLAEIWARAAAIQAFFNSAPHYDEALLNLPEVRTNGR